MKKKILFISSGIGILLIIGTIAVIRPALVFRLSWGNRLIVPGESDAGPGEKILGAHTSKNTTSATTQNNSWKLISRISRRTPTPPPPVPTPGASFTDAFTAAKTIEETGAMSESSDTNWWLSSGGRWLQSGGLGQTIHGSLSLLDKWRLDYALSNPVDTDNGYHPQNIFRFVERGTWTNYTQQVYVRIDSINMSTSPNRNASNGLFLFNRYLSGDTLYYTGLRVDGAAVIKKKLNGTYTTMDYRTVIKGAAYQQTSNPNLLPVGTWVGLRSTVTSRTDGTVSVTFEIDLNNTGNWQIAAQAIDDGQSFGGAPIVKGGNAGIRTDFMDATFKNYSIQEK